MSYIASVYAFSDEEFETMFTGVECSSKCIGRRVYMKRLVDIFHEKHGVIRQEFK